MAQSNPDPNASCPVTGPGPWSVWAISLALLISTLADGNAIGAGGGQSATRTVAVGSFERVRVDGPFEVKVATGQVPRAKVTGPVRAVDALVIDVQGGTLTVRARPLASGEPPQAAASRLTIDLATPLLRSGSVQGGGRLSIAPMKAERIDLSVSGSGELSVDGARTDQLNATLVGTGRMRIAGQAQRALLQSQGAGTIDAATLTVNDLTIRADGTGDTRAAARYTARITASGLGAVTVSGRPACTVRSSGSPVTCGPPR